MTRVYKNRSNKQEFVMAQKKTLQQINDKYKISLAWQHWSNGGVNVLEMFLCVLLK